MPVRRHPNYKYATTAATLGLAASPPKRHHRISPCSSPAVGYCQLPPPPLTTTYLLFSPLPACSDSDPRLDQRMARATAPSAMAAAAAAAASPPPAGAAAASLVPKRRATATATARSALSRPHQPRHHQHRRRLALPVVVVAPGPPKRATCACSPTTHPGSFRCALHRAQGGGGAGGAPLPVLVPVPAAAPVSSRLSAPRRASMANPLVRIAAVEGGDQIRRALAALVRPPPSQTRRRADASRRPTPSRLSAMSSAAPGP